MDLNEDIKWLKAKEKRRFEIYDANTEMRIYKGISAAEIIEEFDDFDTFFEMLKEKGHEKIAIQKAHKHGNGQIRDGIMHKYQLIGEEAGKSQLVAGGGKAKAAPSSTNIPAQNPAGLMGSMGLGFADVMRMNTEAENYRNEKEKADRLQRKIDKLEAENKQLERDNLRYELGVEAKPGAVEKLLNMVSQNPELISTAIQALAQAKQPATAALNAPAESQVSKLKAALIQALQQDSVTDELAMMLYHVIRQSANKEFMAEFKSLLKNHLKPVENGTA